jgi:hypothetical protein
LPDAVDNDPIAVVAIAANGALSKPVDIPVERRRAKTIEVDVNFPAARRLKGLVETVEGKPVSNLRIRLASDGPERIATTNEYGNFEFDDVGAASETLYVESADWASLGTPIVVFNLDETPGVVRMIVGKAPRIRGKLRIDGKPPGEPVLVVLSQLSEAALDPKLLWAEPFDVTNTNSAGEFALVPQGAYWTNVIPKKPATPRDGGYRNFRDEFEWMPKALWPWQFKAPANGDVEWEIDMASDGTRRVK